MKKNHLLLAALVMFTIFTAHAQVKIDHAIIFTGSGTNAKVTGIADVSGDSDAISVDYLQKGSLIYGADNSVTANTYTVPMTPALSGSNYTVGMVVNFKANLANTGGVTLNVNGFGAASVFKNYNVPLVANDIQSGQMVTVMYDGTNWQMLSQIGNTPSTNNNSAGDPTLIYTTNGF
jgi:hypothetical protein